jgi:hypothetical protein
MKERREKQASISTSSVSPSSSLIRSLHSSTSAAASPFSSASSSDRRERQRREQIEREGIHEVVDINEIIASHEAVFFCRVQLNFAAFIIRGIALIAAVVVFMRSMGLQSFGSSSFASLEEEEGHQGYHCHK